MTKKYGVQYLSVWPLWPNFKGLWQFVKVLFSIWENFKPTLAIRLILIIVNGQILNKLPSHLVALLTAFSAEQSSFIISIINRPKYFLRFVTIYDGPRHVLLLIFVVCDTSGGCEPNLRSFCLGHFCTRQMPIWNWLLFKWLFTRNALSQINFFSLTVWPH